MGDGRGGSRAPLAAKVPEITALFWLAKVLTTGMGEAASDYLAALSIPLAAVVGLSGFVVAMWDQLRTRRYQAWAYWFAVAMVAVFGTMAADALHVVLHIPYTVTTAGYAVALVAVLVVWHRTEGTLSIHSITTRRRELFYWTTVLVTFALGTAAGDFAAFTRHLGYLPSGRLFGAVMLVGNVRISLEHGLEPLAGAASSIPDFGELFEVAGDLTFMPRDQDRLDVREVFVQRRATDAGRLGDLRHRHRRRPVLGRQRRRSVQGRVTHRAAVRPDRLVPQLRHRCTIPDATIMSRCETS